MKKMKWLRKVPVLLLALILATVPVLMVVPVNASSAILDGSGYYRVDLAGSSVIYDLPFSNVVFFIDTAAYIDAAYLFVSDDPITVNGGNGTITISASTLSFVWLPYGVDIPLVFDFRGYKVQTADGPKTFDHTGFVGAAGDVMGSHGLFTVEPYFVSYSGVLDVFSGVGSWLSGAIQSATTMFWTAESGMTVLGYLAVASLALAVILLIFSLIAGWLKFH